MTWDVWILKSCCPLGEMLGKIRIARANDFP